MEPLSTNTRKQQTPPDPAVEQLSLIAAYMDVVIEIMRRQERHLVKLEKALEGLTTLVDGFTASGASFRASQIDPMVITYAAILGPILGDRIDAITPDKGETYIDEMLKGAAPMARRLLRELDAYLSARGSLDYLEQMAGDIKEPGEQPPQET